MQKRWTLFQVIFSPSSRACLGQRGFASWPVTTATCPPPATTSKDTKSNEKERRHSWEKLAPFKRISTPATATGNKTRNIKEKKGNWSTDSRPNLAQRANPSSPVIERNYIQFFDNSRKNTKMTVSFFEATFAPSSRLLGRSVASYCSP